MKLTAYILVMLGVAVSAQAYDDYQYVILADCQGDGHEMIVDNNSSLDYSVQISRNGREVFKKKIDKEFVETGMYRELSFWSTDYVQGSPDVAGGVGYPGSYSLEKAKGDVTYWDKDQKKLVKAKMICKKLF